MIRGGDSRQAWLGVLYCFPVLNGHDGGRITRTSTLMSRFIHIDVVHVLENVVHGNIGENVQCLHISPYSEAYSTGRQIAFRSLYGTYQVTHGPSLPRSDRTLNIIVVTRTFVGIT